MFNSILRPVYNSSAVKPIRKTARSILTRTGTLKQKDKPESGSTMSAHKLQHTKEMEDLRANIIKRTNTLEKDGEIVGGEPGLADVKKESKRGSRRLIVACDGTWVNSDADAPSPTGVKALIPGLFSHTNVTLPSNITRLCRAMNTNAISTSTTEPKPSQIIYYHRGIGTSGGLEDKIVGGATGASISEHIRECYSFIINNYQADDEIFIFGFSRGAYTARAISTLINDLGLLTAKGMEYFYEIFEDWKDQNVPDLIEERKKNDKKYGLRGAFAGLDARPTMPSKEYVDELQKRGYTRPSVPIKVLGVFDTVGALGVPPILGLHISTRELLQYSFVDTKVAQVVEHAIQALALDDHRAAFTPAVWELPDQPNNLQTLTQVWFPGVHCNIGGAGGYEDQSLANDTLAWMVSELQTLDDGGPILDFDTEYLHYVFKLNIDKCNSFDSSVGGYRGWSLGKMEETLSAAYSFVGDVKPWEGWENWKDWAHPGDLPRTPGRYESFDARSGRRSSTGRPLRGSNEKVHPSARVRMAMGGKGLDDKGTYFPKSMAGWKVVGPAGKEGDPLAEGFSWVGKDKDGNQIVLHEEKLGGLERELLGLSAEAVALAKLEEDKAKGNGAVAK